MTSDIGIRVVVLGVGEARRSMGMVRSDLNGLTASIEKASGVSSVLASRISALGSGLSRFGRTLSLTVTTPILALGGSLVAAGINFEDAFAGVAKTVEGVSYGFKETAEAMYGTSKGLQQVQIDAVYASQKFGSLTDQGKLIRDQFRALALDIPTSASELARIGETAGALGVPANQVTKFTETIAKLGVATNITSEDAGNAIARFANIMGVSGDQLADFATKAGSAIVDLGNKSAATESDIIAMAYRISGAGKAVGLTAQEIIGLSTSVAELGIQSEQGGSAVSRIFLEMSSVLSETVSDSAGQLANITARIDNEISNLKSTIQTTNPTVADLKLMFMDTGLELGDLSSLLTGVERGTISLDKAMSEIREKTLTAMSKDIETSGSKLAAFASMAGVTADEFKNLVRNSPVEAFKRLAGGLAKAQEEGTLTSEMLTDLDLNTIRLRDVINRLGPDMGNLNTNISNANKAWAEGIALDEEAEKRYKTVKSQIILLKNAFAELGIVIFDLYKNDISRLVTGFRNFVKKLSETNSVLIKSAVKIALIVAAIGPVLVVLGTFIQLVGVAVGGLLVFGPVLGGVVAVAGIAAVAIMSLGKSLSGIKINKDTAKGLSNIAYWIGKAFSYGKKGGNIFSGIGSAIRSLTYIYKDNKRTFFSEILKSFGMGEKSAERLGMKIRNFLTPILMSLSNAFMQIGYVVGTVSDLIKEGDWGGALEATLTGILELFGMSKKDAEDVTESIKNITQTLLDFGLSLAAFFINSVLPVIKEVARYIIEEFVPKAIPVIENLVKAFKALWDDVSPKLDSLLDWFTVEALPAIEDFLNKIVPLLEKFTGELVKHPELLEAIGIIFVAWKALGVVTMITQFGTALAGAAASAGLLGTSLLPVLLPLALAAGLIYLYATNTWGFKDALDGVLPTLQEWGDKLNTSLNSLSEFIEEATGFSFSGTWEDFTNTLTTIADKLGIINTETGKLAQTGYLMGSGRTGGGGPKGNNPTRTSLSGGLESGLSIPNTYGTVTGPVNTTSTTNSTTKIYSPTINGVPMQDEAAAAAALFTTWLGMKNIYG